MYVFGHSSFGIEPDGVKLLALLGVSMVILLIMSAIHHGSRLRDDPDDDRRKGPDDDPPPPPPAPDGSEQKTPEGSPRAFVFRWK